jgi:hypothetical protein
VTGDLDESEFGGIGVLQGKKLVHVEIAICDFPIGSEPSISEDTWQEISEHQSLRYRVFRSRETLAPWNRDP